MDLATSDQPRSLAFYPGGASLGVWQAGTHGGFTVLDEPGAPSWFELHTRDYDAVLAFYRDVLGWQTTTMADAPDFRYTVAVAGGEQLAGVMDGSGFLPEGAPSQWAVYVNVDDGDATLAQAVALGGDPRRPHGRRHQAPPAADALSTGRSRAAPAGPAPPRERLRHPGDGPTRGAAQGGAGPLGELLTRPAGPAVHRLVPDGPWTAARPPAALRPAPAPARAGRERGVASPLP